MFRAIIIIIIQSSKKRIGEVDLNRFIILPGSDEGNRGDQALVIQTKRTAEEAGFTGEYSVLSVKHNEADKSAFGIKTIDSILEHPGRNIKNKDNLVYTVPLILKWGFIAAFDFINTGMLLHRLTRPLAKCFLSKSKKRTLKEFKNCDACFVKGGGFLHSYGSYADIYRIYFFLYHIRLALKLKKPVYVMPNSFGPFSAPGVKRQIKSVLPKCKMLTARESISANMLAKIDIHADVYPDLAFSLEKSSRPLPEFDAILKIAGERKPVGITARPYRFTGGNIEKQYERYVDSLAETCKWLYENGFYPVLIEHVIAENLNESDMKCINDIRARLNDGKYSVFSNSGYDCMDFKQLYSRFYAVIGTRFHSVIFSLAEGVPCVALTYGGNKGQGIMLDNGLSAYALDIETVTFDKIIAAFKSIEMNSEEYRAKLEKLMENNLAAHAELVERLSSNR